MLKSQIVSTLTDELNIEWQQLWKKSKYSNTSNSPCWFKSALNAFRYKEIKIITIRDNTTGELRAVAPFVKRNMFSVSLYTSPALEFADKNQILADFQDKKIIRELFSEIIKIDNIYLSSFTREMLDASKPYIGTSKYFTGDIEPYINFSQGYYGNLPNRKRTVVLNRMNNSDHKFQIIIKSPDLTKALETSFQIDTASVKNSKGKGVFYDEKHREFYKQLAVRNPSNMIISLIYINQKPVSYLIGFINKQKHTSSQKAYLPGYEYFGLGRLLLIYLMDYFRDIGSMEFGLGKGTDQFKKNFTDHYYQYYNIIITRSILLKFYIFLIFKLKNQVYPFISGHPNIYKFYQSLNTILKSRRIKS